MNNNFNLKQYLSENKLLQEIKINIPTPKFKSNLELRSYFENNLQNYENFMEEIINSFGYGDDVDINYISNGKSLIDTKKEEEEQHREFIKKYPDHNRGEYNPVYNKQNPELSAWDNNENQMILSIEPLQIDYIKDSKEIKLGPNTIYYAWDN